MRQLMLLFAVLAACPGQKPADEGKISLRLLVALSGEHGEIAVMGNVLSMYSPGYIQGTAGRERAAKVPGHDGGSISISVRGATWMTSSVHLEQTMAFRPPLEDRLNQIDLAPNNRKLAEALPRGARLKTVRANDQFSIVVYSTTDAAVRYETRVAVAERRLDGSYSILASDLVSDAGFLCGLWPLGDANHFAVVIDEPAGSSNYLVAFVYAVGRM